MLDAYAIVDGGLLALVTMVATKLITYGAKALGITSWLSKQGDAWIVYICLVAEYMVRYRGKFHLLKNHCSTCGMIGHNSQNCPETNGVNGWKKFADEHYVHAAIEQAVDSASDKLVDGGADALDAANGECTIA